MTDLQWQKLLSLLGCDPGTLDGIFGKKSTAALVEFQKKAGIAQTGTKDAVTVAAIKVAISDLLDGATTEKVNVPNANTGTFWDSIKYFVRREFQCPEDCDGFPVEPKEKLVRLLDALREQFGVEGVISSGVRCGQHNAEVGGVYNSRHLAGLAADICFVGIAPATVVTAAYKLGANYAYSITSDGKATGYVHIDVVL